MRTFFFVCLCLFVSCGQKTKVPKGVLPVPQMTDVLWDLMMADELVSHQYPLDTGTVRFDTSMVLYSQIAAAHQTTQQQFKQSLQFYKSRPDLMQVILDSLTNRTVVPADTTKPVLPVE